MGLADLDLKWVQIEDLVLKTLDQDPFNFFGFEPDPGSTGSKTLGFRP